MCVYVGMETRREDNNSHTCEHIRCYFNKFIDISSFYFSILNKSGRE
jgi:hypothetical protein